MFGIEEEAYPLEQMIDVASGRARADLVLKNALVVNVFTNDIVEGDVAIHRGYIAGIGKYEGNSAIDMTGQYVAPSFIDGHVHIESSMVTPIQYARAVVPHGTGAVIADPHEIANVLGMEGIMFMRKSMRSGLLDFYVMLPSCVPSTDLETNGVALDALDIKPLMTEPYVLGLAEVMNYPGVVYRDPNVLGKIRVALQDDKRIDGHAPGLSGMSLNAYAAAHNLGARMHNLRGGQGETSCWDADSYQRGVHSQESQGSCGYSESGKFHVLQFRDRRPQHSGSCH